MQVGTGKSVLNGIAIGKLKIYKKKDTAISTAPVADTAAELERFEAARQKAARPGVNPEYDHRAGWAHATGGKPYGA